MILTQYAYKNNQLIVKLFIRSTYLLLIALGSIQYSHAQISDTTRILFEQYYDSSNHANSFKGILPNHFPIVQKKENYNSEDVQFIEKFKPVSARDYILNAAKDVNILLINEHHLVPYSRVYISSLLEDLKALGYNKLFYESLSYTDNNLNERGFTINSSGFYTREAMASEMIRTAISSNLKVYPYEQRDSQKEIHEKRYRALLRQEIDELKQKNKKINHRKYDIEHHEEFIELSTRDLSQYINICNAFEPGDKIIIVCGHGHLKKKAYGGWRPLGYWLEKDSRFNCLSVNIADAISQEDNELNNIISIVNPNSPIVLIDDSGLTYNKKEYQIYESRKIEGLYDMNVFFPLNYHSKLELKSHLKNRTSIPVAIPPTNQPPFSIIAFKTTELSIDNNANPFDVLFIENESTIPIMYLDKGTFEIYILQNDRLQRLDNIINE